MNIGEGAILGVVQGLTEFLPVSSTAHLRIVPAFARWRDPGSAFSAVIQLGTMLAIVVYFWRDICRIVLVWFRGLRDKSVRPSLDYRMGWYVIFATIPVGVFGLIFRHQITTGGRNLWLISSALIALALVLLAAERVGTRTRTEDDITLRDGLIVGLAQAASLVPGVSRSGSTITAGLFCGLTREAAARFSFLLSVPAVVLSGLFELKDIGGKDSPSVGPTVMATILAFVVGLASIHWLLRFLGRHSTFAFIGYRVLLGAVVLILLAAGVVDAT
ncbi:MAG: undecaprenyl-diphosphate phosphatase [Mycobacteriales bacterium]